MHPALRAWGTRRPVYIDPCYQSGEPSLAGTGKRTSILAGHDIGGDTVAALAKSFDLKRAQIMEAIRYECACAG